MDKAQGKKIYYGIVLDNAQLRRDAEQSKSIFRGIGDASESNAFRIDSAWKAASGTLMKMGATLSAVELAKGIYSFADRFERSMTEVTTISETVTNDLGKFKQEIIEMSTEVPVPADEAAKALYQIVSAGHDGAAGMEVLRVSAKAAVGGVTETATAADAITSVMNAYKKGAGEAENISDQLFTTVRLGKTTMGELGHSISQAIPIAAAFGIESEQVLAAIATLTKSGTPTAQAVTQIRAAINAASKALGDGYFKTHTFQEGLQAIADKAGGSEARLRALVPEVEAVNGILGLTGINAQIAASDLAELSNSARATEAAFQKMASETGAQLTLLKNNVLAEFSEWGESMVDNVGKVAAALNEAFDSGKIEKVISVLASLIAMYGTYKATLIAVSAVESVARLAKQTREYIQMARALGLATANQIAFNRATIVNPYVAVATAIAAVVGGLVLYSNKADKATKASEALNKSIDEETKKLDKAYDSIKKAQKGTDERKIAIDAFNEEYGQYLSNLLSEKSSMDDLTTAYKEAKQAMIDLQIEKARSTYLEEPLDDLTKKTAEFHKQLGDWTKELSSPEQQARFTAYVDQMLEDIKNGGYFDINRVYDAFRAAQAQQSYPSVDAWKEAFREGQESSGISDMGIINRVGEWDVGDINILGQDIQRLQGVLNDAESDFERFSAAYKEVLNPQSGDSGAGQDDKPIALIKTEVKETTALIAKLKQQLADLRSGKVTPEKGSVAEAIDAKAKELKDAESKYKLLTGRDANDTAKAFDEYEKIVLAAREHLASEEIKLERSKIENKADLIKFDQQQIIASIKKTREEALKAWIAKGGDANAFDDSIFQDLIKAANSQAAFDIEKVNKDQAEKEREELNTLLKEFQTYEQKRVAIVEEYGEKITKLRAAGEEEAAGEAERQRDIALASLSQSIMEESDLWVRLFEDASTKTVSEIEGIINETQALLDYLQGKEGATIPVGFSEKDLEALKLSPEVIEKIQEAMKKLTSEAVQKNPFAALAKNLKDLFAAGTTDDKTEKKLAKLGESAAVSANMIGGLATSLSDMFSAMGNDELSGAMDTVQDIMSSVSNIGEGFAKGGIVGGAFAVAGELAKGIGKIFQAEAMHREALESVMNSQIDQQQEYNLLLLQKKLLYEEGATIFGNEEYGKAKRAVEVYKEALADFNDAIGGNEAQRKSQQGKKLILEMFGIKDAQSTLKQIYAGLADISIKTGHEKTGIFGWGKGEDVYSSILNVYPDLISANGEFNKELAETILATREMSEEDKKALQNMVELYEQHEEAMRSMRDYLGSIFGELGNTMSDALVDAFRNGTDAGEAFYKSVSGMLENLAEQMIYSVTLAPIMEKAQDQMLEIMQNGDLTDAEKFSQYAGVLSNLTDQALAQQENANYLMKLYQDMAAEKGIDIFQPDAERQASSKGIATASQDSVDELNGRFTAIQGHTFDIRAAVNAIAASKTQDLMKIEINTERLHSIDANVYGIREASNLLVANSARILQHLAGIEDNTSRLHAMDDNLSNLRSELRAELSAVRHTVGSIADKGIKLKR